MQIVITMPVCEDWDSAIELCQKIDLVFRDEKSLRVSLLLIDDGSTISTPPREVWFRPEAIENISILVLRRNLGHQRAIAIALAHLGSRSWGSGEKFDFGLSNRNERVTRDSFSVPSKG